MNVRFAVAPPMLGAFLFLPLPGPGADPAAAQECRAPLQWKIEAVDPLFGLTDQEASDAVRQAGMVWSVPMETPLLFQESEEGVSIRFVFDDRMETTLERRRREEEIAARAREIDESTGALEASRLEMDRRRDAHGQRVLDMEARQESHNRAVEYWNQAGGAPPAEYRRLQAIEEEIAELRSAVNEEAEEINRMVEAANGEADRLNREIAALNQARAELARALPRGTMESAEYRQSGGGLFSGGTREIDIFQFENRDHLIRVLAHVLGHAMGLGHSETPGSLMEANATASAVEGRPQLHVDDLAQLQALCPAL